MAVELTIGTLIEADVILLSEELNEETSELETAVPELETEVEEETSELPLAIKLLVTDEATLEGAATTTVTSKRL